MRRTWTLCLLTAALAGCYTQIRGPESRVDPVAEPELRSPPFEVDPIEVFVLHPVAPVGLFHDPWLRTSFGPGWDPWASPRVRYGFGSPYVRRVDPYLFSTWPHSWSHSWWGDSLRWHGLPDHLAWWRRDGHRSGPIDADDETRMLPRPRIRRSGFEGVPVSAREVREGEAGAMQTKGSVPDGESEGTSVRPSVSATERGTGERRPDVRQAKEDTTGSATTEKREAKRKSQRRRGGMK